MALIKCSECNKEISDKATTCPGCGCPTPFKLNNPAEPADILSCSKCGYKGHVSTAILTNFGSRTECPKCHSGLYANIVPGVLEAQSTNGSTVKPSTTFTESSQPNSPEIPTGLYWATAILGFPLGTGIALGCNIGANSRINKGDYAKAQKYIDSTKIACWVIIVPCAIAALFLLSMCSLMFR